MATYEEALNEFREEMDKIGMHHHDEVYQAITKYLGPSIHDRDASLVACSDPDELALIKKNFLIGKLGLEEGKHLDDALAQACAGLGVSNKNKHRATFYYLLTAILNKGDVFRK